MNIQDTPTPDLRGLLSDPDLFREAALINGKWLERAEAGTGLESQELLSLEDQAGEYLMMGLRLTEGLDVERLRALDKGIAPVSAIRDLQELGLVEQNGPMLRATGQGRLVLNSVIAALLP